MKVAPGLAAVAAVLMLTACSVAMSEAELKDQARIATADALSLDAAIAAIEVTTVERNPSSSNWVAHYDGNILNCTGTETFQLPDCRLDTATASN